MAREIPKKVYTKKHMARVERERMQMRYIKTGTAVVIGLVVLLIIVGVLDLTVLRPNQAVAKVDNERITTREFQTRARYMRSGIVQRYYELQSLQGMFGDDPNTQQYLQTSLSQLAYQLNTEVLGEQVLDSLIEEAIIRKEAARLGITVSEAEIDVAMEEAFGFYEQGTPTPTATIPARPVSTLSPAQLALITPTPTVGPTAVPTTTLETATPEAEPAEATPEPLPTEAAATAEPEPEEPAGEPTVTPTTAPIPTATPYTRDAFETQYKEVMDNFTQNVNFTEKDFRELFEMQLLREKVMEAVVGDIQRDQEMVWTRQITVADEATARDLFGRIATGEDFGSLAAEFTLDGFGFSGGDQGWDLPSELDPAIAAAIANFQTGDITDPIQTASGWTIVQLLGREVRTLEPFLYDQLRQERFQEWLDAQRESRQVEVYDVWKSRVPTTPSIPQA
jgi:parvulin-like peptidyl-prolyl isomerase